MLLLKKTEGRLKSTVIFYTPGLDLDVVNRDEVETLVAALLAPYEPLLVQPAQQQELFPFEESVSVVVVPRDRVKVPQGDGLSQGKGLAEALRRIFVAVRKNENKFDCGKKFFYRILMPLLGHGAHYLSSMALT